MNTATPDFDARLSRVEGIVEQLSQRMASLGNPHGQPGNPRRSGFPRSQRPYGRRFPLDCRNPVYYAGCAWNADSLQTLTLARAPDKTGLALGALLMDVQDLLQRRVDVVTEKSLHPALRERVLTEAQPI